MMAAATSSLPVPLSPSISTGESVTATLPMMSLALAITCEEPISSLTAKLLAQGARAACGPAAQEAPLHHAGP